MKLQRPILVGGLGLSFSLWLMQILHHSMMQIGEFSLLSVLAVGGGLWLFQQRTSDSEELDSIIVDRATVEEALSKVNSVVSQLAIEAESSTDIKNSIYSLEQQISALTAELDRQEIHITVTGGKSVGKTTLIQALESSGKAGKVSFDETSPLFIDANSDVAAFEQANVSADLVLFLTNGDLTDTEFQFLHQFKLANHTVIMVWNKQDQYLPDERANLLSKLKARVQQDVVATAVSPLPMKVRKHNDDGSVQEWMEKPAADIGQLTQQLDQVLVQQLVWATTLRKTKLLQTQAKNLLNDIRRDRAQPIIEQYQWIAAAAAFANPVPALDILATAAINAQMVMDLGNIYQQKFSLEQAKTVAGEIGGLMLKLGLVELSTKAISTLLKSNTVTFVAGGALQGVSAAYLTRVAGLSLVEYFQQQEIAINSSEGLNLEKLKQSLQNVFGQSQQMVFLQGFVKQVTKHLLPQTTVIASN